MFEMLISFFQLLSKEQKEQTKKANKVGMMSVKLDKMFITGGGVLGMKVPPEMCCTPW